MGTISLLDCTLGDGGQVNDWRFGASVISSTLRGLAKSKIELIEAGVIQDRKCGTSRTVFDAPESAPERLCSLGHAQYILSVDLRDNSHLSVLPQCEPAFGYILRVVFGKKQLEKSLRFCKDAINKGYTLIIHPAHTIQYSVAEYHALVMEVKSLKPFAFYIDNQSGALSAEEIRTYLSMADEILDERVAIGCRTTNNGACIYELLHKMLTFSGKRDMILDTSLCGMGKYGGKPSTEYLSHYLNEQLGKTYTLPVIQEIAEKFIAPISLSIPWGYLIQHAVAARLRFAPEYVDFYTNRFKATVKEMEEISEWITPQERWDFTPEKAKSCWKAYFQSKMNLAVIVPTCNRALAIQHLLFSSAASFERYGIDVIIYDSSDDDKTEAVVKNYQIDGYNNVKYVRYTGDFDGFSLDSKLIDAYMEFIDQYEYLWLCRDGLIITINDCYRVLQMLTERKFDYIVMDASFRNNNQKKLKVYKSNQEFFKEQAVTMVTLGTLVLSSNIVRQLVNQYPIDESNYSLWQMIVPFYYCVKHRLKIVGYVGEVFTYNTAGTPNSFWNSAGKAMQQWAYYWVKEIQGLPQEYEPYKKDILKIEMVDFHPFYLSSLLRMRRNGGLTIGLIQKYSTYLPYVSNTPMWKFYTAAVIPKWVARLMIDSMHTRFMHALIAFYQLFMPQMAYEKEEDT